MNPQMVVLLVKEELSCAPQDIGWEFLNSHPSSISLRPPWYFLDITPLMFVRDVCSKCIVQLCRRREWEPSWIKFVSVESASIQDLEILFCIL